MILITMDQSVSKLRTKKAKSRLKNASKGVHGKQRVPIRRKPAIGMLLGLTFWAIAMALLDAHRPLSDLPLGERVVASVPEGVMLGIGLLVSGLLGS